MPSHTDTTFITNEEGQNLRERFKKLLATTQFFDVLVGYFYTSGFYALCDSLEKTEKVRILIGIKTNRETLDLMQQSLLELQPLSNKEIKDEAAKELTEEIENSEDKREVEDGIKKFVEWVQSGKLEIKAYPSERIHAKLYIMTFAEDDRDAGRVITGSSNFTQAGLVENLEFNVELKERADYDFAKEKFEELWKGAVDVSERYIETIDKKTYLNENITPYQLYLKFLYEYFNDQLNQPEDLLFKYVPDEFMKLEYQRQAVLNAKKILEEYGGVFISDVVGLGKTYVSAMLAGQITGRTLVLAPPALLSKKNPGSWTNVFHDFRVPAEFESLGKLDHVIDNINRGTRYDNIFIDEAHRFRTESNITYEKLAQICRGKKVVLVTATPLNNTPKDILSQIKLFMSSRNSPIPNKPDLETFFAVLEGRLAKLDRKKNHDEYIQTSKQNAREIRESVLKYLMVRRTRREIQAYFKEDLNEQGLKFPDVENPEALYYQLNHQESNIFDETIQLVTKDFKYARYIPMGYYKGSKNVKQETHTQRNIGVFMKILLIKRLESSFHAFQTSVARFINYYDKFLAELDKGNVYVSKKYTSKIFDLSENDDEEAIQVLLDDNKAERYPASDFEGALKAESENDLKILNEIQELWKGITRDPKLEHFVDLLENHPILKEGKVIVFTESKDTAVHLGKKLDERFSGNVLVFHGSSDESARDIVTDNFDARVQNKKDDFRILVTTEVLSEGVNLHRSNTVVNYDIPWNPTRLMQRVGRINRVDTDFDTIYSFNFFPTDESNDEIKLKEAAQAKISAFITLLGSDAKLLTDGEVIESHELFERLNSKNPELDENEEEEESELKHFQVIKKIRDKDPDLFEQVKRLPKKARTSRKNTEHPGQLLTYFRKGKIQKFFLSGANEPEEQDFMAAAGLLEAAPKDQRENMPYDDFYDKLEKNKVAFISATTQEKQGAVRGGSDSRTKLLKHIKAILSNTSRFTEEQEDYLKNLIDRLDGGDIPKQTAKTAVKELKQELESGSVNPLKLVGILQKTIAKEFENPYYAENTDDPSRQKREVILSEYLVGN